MSIVPDRPIEQGQSSGAGLVEWGQTGP